MIARDLVATRSGAARILLVTAAVFLGGELGVDLSRLSGNVAALWIANAIPLGIVLLRPRSETLGYIAAAAIGNLVMNLANGDGIPVAVALAGCNAGEVLVATALLRVLDGTQILTSLRATLIFLAAAVAASTALTAAVGAGLVSTRLGASYWDVWRAWWMGDAVGMLIVTPAVVAIGQVREMKRPSVAESAEILLILSALVTASAIGFRDPTTYSLFNRSVLLTILPLEIWAIVRFGVAGATAGNATMCLSALASMYLGIFPDIDSSGLRADLEAAQLLMVTNAAMTLVLAALLSERGRLLARLRSAIEAMHEGFTLTDETGRLVLVNKQIRKIYPGLADAFVPGARMEDLVRAGIAKGVFDLNGRSPEEWLAWRMNSMDAQTGGTEIRLADGRCLLLSERREISAKRWRYARTLRA